MSVKVETSELTGAALDWTVAKCENTEVVLWNNDNGPEIPMRTVLPFDNHYPSFYSPSTDWSQGGSIIEREKISIIEREKISITHFMDWQAQIKSLKGFMDSEGNKCFCCALICQHGQTLLVAAMRCYVASKLGDVVEVPDELVAKPSNEP